MELYLHFQCVFNAWCLITQRFTFTFPSKHFLTKYQHQILTIHIRSYQFMLCKCAYTAPVLDGVHLRSIYVTLKDRKSSLSGKKDHNALWHYRNRHNAKFRVVAVFKRPQRVVAWEKQPELEMSFKWTVYKFSNLLINNTCNVGLMKNNGEARLFLQELLEGHNYTSYFSEDICTFIEAVPLTMAA